VKQLSMMCSNVMIDRFPRCVLREAASSGCSGYNSVLHRHIAVNRCHSTAVGSYRACNELVLKHISVIRLVCSTSLLCYIVNLCNGKEILVRGIVNAPASLYLLCVNIMDRYYISLF